MPPVLTKPQIKHIPEVEPTILGIEKVGIQVRLQVQRVKKVEVQSIVD
jgi:hypothetical protein